MLTLSNISYRYEEMAMCFDLSAEQGDIVAIIGPSGSGKSTLLALVSGFLQPEQGTLTIAGEKITDQAPNLRPLSILFQDHNLFPHLTVEENIGLGLHPGLKLSTQDKQLIRSASQRVGLDGYLSRLPEQLSGGQKQRVALARCLVRQRPLLLLDEPFSALDPALRKEMLDLVHSLAKEQSITVLMVTHSPDDALKIADKCAFIEGGKVAAFGDTQTLLSDTDNGALKRYLGK